MLLLSPLKKGVIFKISLTPGMLCVKFFVYLNWISDFGEKDESYETCKFRQKTDEQTI